MKIEVGESLACSYLRHVERCWLAQANWKVSEHWERSLSDAEIDALFQEMKRRFDRNGAVFKKTKDAAQFLKQGEIDAIGVDQQGGVHAMEVAFHEAGLNYPGGTVNNVLKKMLRSLLILRAYLPPTTSLHISFLSPKVYPAVQRPLEETFAALREAYPDVGWRLITNDKFAKTIVKPTLEKAGGVADSSELFVRSVKLLELMEYRPVRPKPTPPAGGSGPTGKFQLLVRALMQTLLVDSPDLLSDAEKRDLQDNEYCKHRLGLQIGNLPLIRRIEFGTQVNEHPRYWSDRYGEFYVCNNWWKGHHCANAESLLAFVEELACEKEGQPGAAALGGHAQAFRDYLASECP